MLSRRRRKAAGWAPGHSMTEVPGPNLVSKSAKIIEPANCKNSRRLANGIAGRLAANPTSKRRGDERANFPLRPRQADRAGSWASRDQGCDDIGDKSASRR